MPDTATLDRAGDAEIAASPVCTRAHRRAALRRTFARRALALTAGTGIAATTLAFVALSSPAKARAQVHLPSARAADAAFLQGLSLGGSTASTLPAAAAVVPAATPVGTTAIMIKNYTFSPAALTVASGSKVTWTNMDTAPHTVTIHSGPVKFSSPTLQHGDTFTYTFTAPGTYTYYCAVHPDMTATLTVTGPSPTSATPTSSAPSSPAPTTSGMGMSPGAGGTETCVVSNALQALFTHINAGHLGESPGQQVQDILNVDQYIGTHLSLIQRMLAPATTGGLSNAVSTTLQSLFTHINAGHLGESPGQQVQDILNVNQYIGTHLSLVQKMASGWEDLAC